MSNRQQRRAAAKKGKRPGQNYADVLAEQKLIQKAVEKSTHDHAVAIESDIKAQRFMWMAVIALNDAFGFGGDRAKRFLKALCRDLRQPRTSVLYRAIPERLPGELQGPTDRTMRRWSA